MSMPTRTALPILSTAVFVCVAAAALRAEVLPERRCGVNWTADLSTRHPDLTLPKSTAACEVTVIFETGSAILAPEARRALDQAAPEVIAHLALGGTGVVEGHVAAANTDETMDLSLRRARAVAGYFETAWGIPSRRLALRGRGPARVEGHTPHPATDNRRATLVLHPASAAAAGVHRTWPVALRSDHLDLDDFGGARNPLSVPIVRTWTAPDLHHE